MNTPGLIGVIHLPPLPGAPRAQGMEPSALLHQAGLTAVEEAQLLIQAGFEGIILENFGDIPFYRNRVPAETIASTAVIAAAIREAVEVPIGVNLLRNDGFSALAVASVTGCDFIRVNVLSGVAATDQGMIEGEAAQIIRERERLGAQVSLLADVHVKHAVTLSSMDLELAIEDACIRALADGVILTGKTTGRAADLEHLKIAYQVTKRNKVPLFLGSGATYDTLEYVTPWVDGVIVGSALRKGGIAGAALEVKRVRQFADSYFRSRKLGKSKMRKGKKRRK